MKYRHVILPKKLWKLWGLHQTKLMYVELSRPTQLRIQLGKGMDEPGRPFYHFAHVRENNPRLEWVLNALSKGGVQLQASSPQMLEESWSEVSGQFSQGMQTSAIFAILIALGAILVYITIRFEWKYALASVIGLVHDLLLTLALLAIFHAFGFAVEIDLVVVGALMTIIGYSLNNTIIIFDRVREDIKILRKSSFYDVITHALNETLSRTILTSGTTLSVAGSLAIRWQRPLWVLPRHGIGCLLWNGLVPLHCPIHPLPPRHERGTGE